MTVTLTCVGFCRQRAWFADRSSFFRFIRFPAMIAIIRHPALGTLLFDTGYGRALEESVSARAYRSMLPFSLPDSERLPARLVQFGVSRVDRVFLSHFHPDHIGGLRDVPGVPEILHSRPGLSKLRSLRGVSLRRSAFFAELLPDDFDARGRAIEDLPRAVGQASACAELQLHHLDPGYDIAGDGSLIAIPLPGHAAGQYGLLCRFPEDGRRLLLCADAAWLRSNIGSDAARPAWPVRLLVDDYAQFHQTLDRLDQFARAHPDVRIIPSHCEDSIGPLD